MPWPKGKARPDAFKRKEDAVSESQFRQVVAHEGDTVPQSETESEVQPTKEEAKNFEEEEEMIWMPPHVNVDEMTKQDCFVFGMRHFGLRLDQSKLVHEMRHDVQRLLSTKQHQRYR